MANSGRLVEVDYIRLCCIIVMSVGIHVDYDVITVTLQCNTTGQ